MQNAVDLDPDNPLAAEIRQEMAQAYFAACKKMVATLDALKLFDHETTSSQLKDQRARQRNELLDAAGERIYYVIIQREAMKLPMHDGFFEDYDIPDEVRTRIGPRSTGNH